MTLTPAQRQTLTWTVIAAAALLLLWLLWLLAPVLTPFVVVAVLTYVLHPLVFALLASGQLFGFVNVLIALPVSAAALVALRRARRACPGSPLYQG